jgi:hypothetical protein
MKDFLLVLGVTVLFVVGVVGLVSISQPDRPTVTTYRLLDSDPEFYAGKLVTFKTEGMEIDDRTGEYIFRKQTDKPPVVCCRFKGRPPEKRPATITGLCIGRQGAMVLVVDCR